MAAESFEKHTFFSPLCLRLVCKHKHRQMCSSSFCSVLYLASLSMVFLLVCTKQLCQPKVRDFHMLRSLNKDVPGSKVTVHQAPFLQIVHSLQCNTLLVRPRALRALTHKSPNLTCFVVTTDTTMDMWQVMPPALSIYMMFIAGRGWVLALLLLPSRNLLEGPGTGGVMKGKEAVVGIVDSSRGCSSFGT